MNPTGKIIKIDWTPQPRQLTAIKACGLSYPFDQSPISPCIADLIGYGGAAGGGKTDTLLAIAILAGTTFQKINIGYFRREFPQLEGAGGAIIRSRELMSHFGKYNEQKKRWTFPNGSILQFNHCATAGDVYNYQSQQFDILLFDEVTQFEKDMVKYLLTRNRQTINDERFKPFAVLATNPGNVGHTYFKDEFVTLGEPEKVNIYWNESGKQERHLFIPSYLSDNRILEQRDPTYRDRLASTEANRKVLLEGDWNYYQGQAFGELSRDKHIVEDFAIPREWRLFGAFDMGFNHPFSFGIFATDRDGNTYLIARATNRLKRPDEIHAIIVETANRVGGFNRLDYIVAGWDCWTRQRDGSPTIAEQFSKCTPKLLLHKAKEDRVQAVAQIRYYISWKNKKTPEGQVIDGNPKFYIFRSCQNVYDVLANMQFDSEGTHPEDVLKHDADENGKGGDDDYDMVRYGLMSRPRAGVSIKIPPKPNSVLGHVERMMKEEAASKELYTY